MSGGACSCLLWILTWVDECRCSGNRKRPGRPCSIGHNPVAFLVVEYGFIVVLAWDSTFLAKMMAFFHIHSSTAFFSGFFMDRNLVKLGSFALRLLLIRRWLEVGLLMGDTGRTLRPDILPAGNGKRYSQLSGTSILWDWDKPWSPSIVVGHLLLALHHPCVPPLVP